MVLVVRIAQLDEALVVNRDDLVGVGTQEALLHLVLHTRTLRAGADNNRPVAFRQFPQVGQELLLRAAALHIVLRREFVVLRRTSCELGEQLGAVARCGALGDAGVARQQVAVEVLVAGELRFVLALLVVPELVQAGDGLLHDRGPGHAHPSASA